MPRRHLAEGDFLLDGFRPRPRLFIGEQRHGRDLSGPMASGAIVVKDRRHISGERGDLIGGERTESQDERGESSFLQAKHSFLLEYPNGVPRHVITVKLIAPYAKAPIFRYPL